MSLFAALHLSAKLVHALSCKPLSVRTGCRRRLTIRPNPGYTQHPAVAHLYQRPAPGAGPTGRLVQRRAGGHGGRRMGRGLPVGRGHELACVLGSPPALHHPPHRPHLQRCAGESYGTKHLDGSTSVRVPPSRNGARPSANPSPPHVAPLIAAHAGTNCRVRLQVPEAHRCRPPWDWAGLACESKRLLKMIVRLDWERLMRHSTLGEALRGLAREAAEREAAARRGRWWRWVESARKAVLTVAVGCALYCWYYCELIDKGRAPEHYLPHVMKYMDDVCDKVLLFAAQRSLPLPCPL